MSIQLLDRLPSSNLAATQTAILEALAYSDVFDYPLRVEEIHRYLPVSATMEVVQTALDYRPPYVSFLDGYYFLQGRDAIVPLRLRRESASLRLLQAAYRIGRILGSLPFIRMVGLTGSLAVLNSGEQADLDYMLITAPNRVWTARAFALLLGRFTARLGATLCPNLIVSEHRLEWPDQSLYSAREICQMIPVSGLRIYSDLRSANAWTRHFLPNASGVLPLTQPFRDPARLLQRLQEMPLGGGMGNRIEAWERTRKINRFTRQPGLSAETHFSADICQGNFDHHRARTRAAFEERLRQLGVGQRAAALNE